MWRTRPGDRSGIRWRMLRRRLLSAVPVLLGVVTVAFGIVHMIPGDPVQIMLGTGGAFVDPEREAVLRHELRLDRPLPDQYLAFLAALLRGDLGKSLQTGEPVTALVAEAAGPSLALAGTALVLGLLLGAGGAVLGELTRSRLLRAMLSRLPVLAMALPAYWVATLLLQVFSFRLGLVPALGSTGPGATVLPAVTLALPLAGVVAHVLGSGLRTADRESYVLMARAKGATRARVVLRHMLRNTAVPVVTLSGTTVGSLLGGGVVAETIFGRPGLGRLIVNALQNHDYPVLQGVAAFLGITMVVISLIVDVAYTYLDPRVVSAAVWK
ncbi:ABC transporter permease [Actinoplanes sp. LDG1-06]|uniref:ABC transporter permease n=1 Tax=Paractinoplanes ovalisporus TaxID=2810368 RepID=A0ABS2AUX8_9ACTN|nr:ABC transporter permease [Actinoplanes ovalisporus]MBM2623634.1 ABC transporter permease [Actinoplanes ovalisporus]